MKRVCAESTESDFGTYRVLLQLEPVDPTGNRKLAKRSGSNLSKLGRQMLLSEVDPNLARFPATAAFFSWLRLCPDPRIVLSSRTRPIKNRAVLAAGWMKFS
jgi:hypothetical protein